MIDKDLGIGAEIALVHVYIIYPLFLNLLSGRASPQVL
jgi:hypothetical protein